MSGESRKGCGSARLRAGESVAQRLPPRTQHLPHRVRPAALLPALSPSPHLQSCARAWIGVRSWSRGCLLPPPPAVPTAPASLPQPGWRASSRTGREGAARKRARRRRRRSCSGARREAAGRACRRAGRLWLVDSRAGWTSASFTSGGGWTMCPRRTGRSSRRRRLAQAPPARRCPTRCSESS